MEHKKAKKAKKMAENAIRLMALEEQMAAAQESDLQPADGYVTPMHRIGTVPPTTYSLGNQLDGTTTQSVINT
jgi:hypothetical protein